VEKFTFSLG